MEKIRIQWRKKNLAITTAMLHCYVPFSILIDFYFDIVEGIEIHTQVQHHGIQTQNVFSTTLSHLIATNSSHFIIPFVPIRDHLPHFHYNFLHHIKFSSFIVFHNTHLIVYFKKFVKLNDIQTKTIQLVIFWNNIHIKLGTLNFPAATMVVCGGGQVVAEYVKW